MQRRGIVGWILSLLWSTGALFPAASFGQVSVTTHRNDTSRTGQNLSETILNTSNVNVSGFGKLFARTVDGQIYAQPLYMPNLSIGGKTRNVVFVATQNDSAYAFDADDPTASAPLWQVSFLSAGITPVPSPDVDPACVDITPQIGVTSTPVIDPASGTIFIVSKTKNTNDVPATYHFFIHALDLLTGAEKFGGPTEIAPQVPGTGVESTGGIVSFVPLQHFNRPGLLLLSGVVYVAFGSACEVSPWHGWIVGYSASNLLQVSVLNMTPNGSDGGIWGGGQGLVADAANNIYVMTGNGTFDNTVGGEHGNSFVKISTTSGLAATDFFTPKNQAALDLADLDLGSGGPMALPGTSLIVGSGKDGTIRVIDTNNMGKFSATANNDVQEFQGVPVSATQVFMGAPIYWNSPNNGPVIYVWGGNDFIKAYQFTGGRFVTTPVSQGTVLEVKGYSNSVPLSLSANGSQAGTGIVWASGALTGNANHTTVNGVLRAFDATDLTKLLWDSTQNTARDGVGKYAKFSPPTIANGKVYLATFSNQLLTYGLFPDFGVAVTPGSSSANPGQSVSYSVAVNAIGGFKGAVTLACSGLPTGASCAFSPASIDPSGASGTSTLTLTTTAATPPATSTVTITGTTASLTHSGTATLVVSDYALTASPASVSVAPGQSAAYTVTVQSQNGFSSAVSLMCSGLPTGASCTFSPTSVDPAGTSATSTLTVTTAATTPMATSTFTITGTTASLTHSGTATLVVSDYALTASPATVSVAPGQSAAYTVTVQSQNGFSSNVSLACSGLPTGASCAFSPASVNPGGASGTSTLTLTTTATTPPATSTFTITGTTASSSHSSTARLVVSDYTLTASPATFSVTAGKAASYTVTVQPQNGFNSAISLSCSGLPNLAACSFTPNSVTPAGAAATSTLTITTMAPTATLKHSGLRSGGAFYAMWLPLSCIAIAGYGFSGKRRRTLFSAMLTGVFVISILSLTQCGGGNMGSPAPATHTPGTPTGTYTVTISGASTAQHSTTITLQVQ